MKMDAFAALVKECSQNLPASREVISEGRSLADGFTIGRSAFLEEVGFSSELEYKRHCIRDKKVMVHAHIGLSTWKDTKKALQDLYGAACERGIIVDRFGLCLDRRMALPANQRKMVPRETGPTLDSEEDWFEVARTVPIQPHMGDFMIGFPASTENTLYALKAGVTTIGNLSQYFSMQAPGWSDQAATVSETVKAIALIGALREKGALLHSYLEDGFGALFYDCATLAGWAMLEKYIVEELLGAKLAHCIGGLTADPVKRAGWIYALDLIHEKDCIGSMFYGNTISFTEDFPLNRGMIAEYMLWDALAQLDCPTGHALLPLPVSEAVRVPSPEEIIDAQVFGRRVIDSARLIAPHFNLDKPKGFAATMMEGGRTVFSNALAGFSEAGADPRDPIQLLYILKAAGPSAFESLFGAGAEDESFPCGRVPLTASDIFLRTRALTETELDKLKTFFPPDCLDGKKILLASTDVHEHALFLLDRVLTGHGAVTINLGAEKSPAEVAEKTESHAPQAIIISTHNGMALEYARALKDKLAQAGSKCPVYFGGKLNQKFEDKDMPKEVGGQIREELGFVPCSDPEELLKRLCGLYK